MSEIKYLELEQLNNLNLKYRQSSASLMISMFIFKDTFLSFIHFLIVNPENKAEFT